MLRKGFFFMLLLLCFAIESVGQTRVVARTHPNGEPYVVVYVIEKKGQHVRVKQEVFYENGNLDYVGHYKNGVEHGKWTYYYEDGTVKAAEQWENGEEEGIQREYRKDGTLQREQHYKKGKLVKDIMH